MSIYPKKKIRKTADWLVKAYDNLDFLNSPPARNIRVLSEMIEPTVRFNELNVRNTVVFFGSARTLSKKDASANLKKCKKGSSKHKKAQNDMFMSKYYEDAVHLGKKLTLWFNQLKKKGHPFYICSGGGPGIMEAANKGAHLAKGESIGLNIHLPMEQNPNKYQTKDLSMEFHYFFIRKFWFCYLAKAIVIFPGGFGTFDEFFEMLTLIQTGKMTKNMPVVLYGKDFWNDVVNFKALAKWGVIAPEDVKLFKICDDPDEAFNHLKTGITKHYLNKSKGKASKHYGYKAWSEL
jgi:uncharacterized protein (TIGR00730 family)